MKSSFPIFSIVMIVSAVALFCVDEMILALVFGAVGVTMLFIKPAQKPAKQKARSAKHTPTVPGAPAPDAYAFNGSVQDYFYALLNNRFPGYELVPGGAVNAKTSGGAWECGCGTANTGKFCTECGAAKPAATAWTCSCGSRNTGKFCPSCGTSRSAVPVADAGKTPSFVLRKDGQARLGIVLCGKNEWRSEKVQNIVESCKAAGFPCICFYNEFRNEAGYVTDRVSKYLR